MFTSIHYQYQISTKSINHKLQSKPKSPPPQLAKSQNAVGNRLKVCFMSPIITPGFVFSK